MSDMFKGTQIPMRVFDLIATTYGTGDPDPREPGEYLKVRWKQASRRAARTRAPRPAGWSQDRRPSVSAHAVVLAAASAQFAVDFDAIEVPVEKGRAPFDERMILALSDLKGEAVRPATPSLCLQQSAGTPALGLRLSPLRRARGAVGRCGASST